MFAKIQEYLSNPEVLVIILIDEVHISVIPWDCTNMSCLLSLHIWQRRRT